MLIFNPKRVFAMRGIEKATGFLVKMGFNYPQATRFLQSNNATVKIKHIERLCFALNCTPNDLFEWKTDGKTARSAETHSLAALDRSGESKSLQEMIRDVPADKLPMLEKLFDELKK